MPIFFKPKSVTVPPQVVTEAALQTTHPTITAEATLPEPPQPTAVETTGAENMSDQTASPATVSNEPTLAEATLARVQAAYVTSTNTEKTAKPKRKLIKPKKAATEPTESTKPKIGIAFGGGGFKGTAHIGVLKVLDEYGIKADMVAGTSIGSAVAALYASGYTWQMMEQLFTKFDLESFIKVRPSRQGLIPATGYTELIHTCVKGKRIEDMDIPLKIVAVDLVSWQKVVFDKGETALAVRASSSIPGVLTPVKMGNMLLADGYILDNCPCGIVREMGADIVIGICLFSPNHAEPQNMVEVINRSLDIATAANLRVDADWKLFPIPHYIESMSTKALFECMQWGEEAARAKIDELLELIAEKTGGEA